MTTPPSLVQRAQQGDAVAIAVLMNEVLQAQDVWVKATLDSNCLQVMLKAHTVLQQAQCVAFIRRGLLRLQPESIKQVIAYAWRVGDAFPLWIAAFPLEFAPLLPSHALARSPEMHSSVQSDSKALANETAPLQQRAKLALPTNAFRTSSTFRQRSELFGIGFVIVLTTVVYFMVTGV